MSEPIREAEPVAEVPAQQETSLIRVLVFPLMVFLVVPALLMLVVKYLFGF